MRSGLCIAAGLALLGLASTRAANAAEESDRTLAMEIGHDQSRGELRIIQGRSPVATYCYRSRDILRPFLANVHAPDGTLLTRPHPPAVGQGTIDHATMHPGLWLAFGDLNGHDFWRNKDRAVHVEFLERPRSEMIGKQGQVTFAVTNRYEADKKVVCTEVARHSVRATEHGYLLMFDSEFSSAEPFTFGDQEEMGLGMRLAAPLAVKDGAGRIFSSNGATNEREVWGQLADWCDYSAPANRVAHSDRRSPPDAAPSSDRRRLGLLLVTHPGNFRRSRMHARDYGLLVANPFAERALGRGQPSRVEVKPGQTLRLRFGIWAYSGDLAEPTALAALADEYTRLAQ